MIQQDLQDDYIEDAEDPEDKDFLDDLEHPPLIIVPGILDTDFGAIKKKLAVAEIFTHFVQIDVEDGKFSPIKTFTDIAALETLETSAEIELDLLVIDPENYIPKSNEVIKKLIFHLESDNFSREVLEEARDKEFLIGLSINPETPYLDLEPFLEYADVVQFMTVHPGPQGQLFMPEVLKSIRDFHREFPGIPIEVDGGINDKTIKLCKEAGVSIFEAGSFLYADIEKFQENFEKLERAIYENK